MHFLYNAVQPALIQKTQRNRITCSVTHTHIDLHMRAMHFDFFPRSIQLLWYSYVVTIYLFVLSLCVLLFFCFLINININARICSVIVTFFVCRHTAYTCFRFCFVASPNSIHIGGSSGGFGDIVRTSAFVLHHIFRYCLLFKCS